MLKIVSIVIGLIVLVALSWRMPKATRGFWNDEDGLSLLDFIALWIIILWGVVMVAVGAIAFCLMLKGQTIDRFWLDYIDNFADVPVAVVIGLYGKGAFGEFGQSVAGLRQSRESMQHQKGGSDNYGDSNYQGQPPL